MVSGKVMVILDSSHRGAHVEAELNLYHRLVSKGQFLVVEDVYNRDRVYWPKWALDRFLAKTDKFKLVPVCEQYIVGVTRGGWLQRVADE
jgi:cephalosporin hydroxylase